MTSLAGLLNRVRGRMDAVGAPYAIGGSFALAALGHPRFTQDLDIMVLTPSLEPIVRAFQGSGFQQINEVTYQDDETGLYVDIYPVEDEAQRVAFARTRPVALHGAAPVPVLTGEALVLMLLREATHGDPRKRPIRLRDIELLAMDGDLDWSWIREHAVASGYGEAVADVQGAPSGAH